jgi:filamentous hemagglutinin family protein
MKNRKLKPLIFAIAAALSPSFAQAAVTATQLPGDGTALYGTATATVSGSAMTVNVTGEDSAGGTIITWGSSGGTLNPNAATGGFNIGSQASVTFSTSFTNSPFVLNVDTTGNPTEIAGTLTEQNGIWLGVANANGIIVDGTAVINAPTGFGLLNQGYSSGDLALQSTSSSTLVLDFANATGGVTIATGAAINADGYVMVAGAGNENIDAPMVNDGPNINVTHFYATNTVSINAPVTDDGADAFFDPIGIGANNIDINAPVTVGVGPGGVGTLGVSVYSLNPPTNGVVTGNLNISSTGSLNGGTVEIAGGEYGASMAGSIVDSIINITDNGSITSPYSGGKVYLGALTSINGTGAPLSIAGSQGLPVGAMYNAIGTVSGSGFISADNITFENQLGPVNNITTGQILANGFHLVAGPSGTASIIVTDGQTSGSGINLMVTGNANFTNFFQNASFTNSASTATANLAPDTAGKLVVQATGTLTVNPTVANWSAANDNFASPSGATYPEFNFPGLVYLLGQQGVTVDAAINTAYSTSTPMGFGVFLLGPTIDDTYPIIANGDRGVNIESTQYGPTTINGTPVTQGNPNLAPIYFLQAGSSGGMVLNVPAPYTTQWQWEAENQVFLVDPNYTGPTYPVNVPQGTVPSSDIFTVTAPATEVVNNITLPADAFSQSYPALSTVKAANPSATIGYSIRSVTVVNGVTEVSLAVYTSKGGTLLAAAQENIS